MSNDFLDKKLSFKKVIPVSFSINISFTISVLWILVLITTPYLIWEIYWAAHVQYAFIKWHTHFMVYFYLWSIGFLFLRYAIRRFNADIYSKLLISYTSIMAVLLLLEVVLYFWGINKTYYEEIGNDTYVSRYNIPQETWYRLHPANNEIWIKKPEYKYIRHTNSLGFSDTDWPIDKRPHEKRILAMGDSFTEGDGTTYDSSYVSILRHKFKGTDSSVSIMNAGIMGDDPFINFVTYRDKLQEYQPDIIIQTLSYDDLATDIETRGGMERFAANGVAQYKKAPWWEPIYAVSYVSRIFFAAAGYDQALTKKKPEGKDKEKLDKMIINLFNSYATLAKSRHCDIWLVLLPDKVDLGIGKYRYDFSDITSVAKKNSNLKVCDLLPFYLRYMKQQDKPMQDYYWHKDGHHNGTGYAMMAEGIYECVKPEENGNHK